MYPEQPHPSSTHPGVYTHELLWTNLFQLIFIFGQGDIQLDVFD